MHQKPDGDAMGSTLGLYHFLNKLGHNCTVISPTNWADFLNWMPACDLVLDYESQASKADTLIDEADYGSFVLILMCLAVPKGWRKN